MQSKFWAAGSTSSSSSEDDESQASDAEIQIEAVAKEQARPAAGRGVAAGGRWANVESSSDEDRRRVVRSAKDKRWDAMRNIIRKSQNHMKISDYGELQNDYEALMRAFQKSKAIVEKEGIPHFFICALDEFEKYVDAKVFDRENFKKLSKQKATSLNTLRSKVRKGNEEFREELDQCRADPEAYAKEDAESSDESDSSSEESTSEEEDESSSSELSSEDVSEDEEEAKDQSTKKATTRVDGPDEDEDAAEADDESSESGWTDSDSDSSEAPSESTAEDVDFDDKHQRALNRWGMKATTQSKSKSTANKIRTGKTTVDAKASKKKEKGTTSGATAQTQSALAAQLQVFDNENVNAELLTKTVLEVVAQRGKKATDRTELIRTLQMLVDAASSVGPQSIMEMLGHLIGGYFDTRIGAFSCLSSAYWLEAHKHLEQVLSILERHPTATFLVTSLAEEEGSKKSGEDRTCAIVSAFLERLDDELTKALQFEDVHSDDYKERLRQSIDLLVLLWKGHIHFLNRKMHYLAANIAFRIIEHLYYKPNALSGRMWEMVKKKLGVEADATKLLSTPIDPTQMLDRLIGIVSSHGVTVRLKVNASLCKIYNLAIHDMYHEAKETLQTGSMQEFASQSDAQTKILYNRALTQLGLCAFRHGLIAEAHSCLSEICAMNRHRELLAQGVSIMKNQERTPEQEREEKRRQLPYHMHIGLDLIEGVHNISAMLLEVPNIAAHPFDHHNKTISKVFRRMLEMHDRQIFVGPPENPRETIIAATKALQRGDAAECCMHIFNLKIWDSMPNKEKIQGLLREHVKVVALRTYLFAYSDLYYSFSVFQLSAMFELPPPKVHSIVSKMMFQEELLASWDESSECIIVNRVEPTPLQVVALKLSERVVQAVDQNEILLNYRNPRYVMQAEQRVGRRFQDDSRWERRWHDYSRAGAARAPAPIARGGHQGGYASRPHLPTVRPGPSAFSQPRGSWQHKAAAIRT